MNLQRPKGDRITMNASMTASIRLLRSFFASICTQSALRLGSVASLFLVLGAACVLSAGAQTAASYREGFQVLGGQQTYPSGVAVDASGNVYLAMPALSAVEKIPVSCINGANNNSCVLTLGGGFSDPLGVAVDASGNVFVADTDNDAIKEIPASCIAGANDSSCVLPLGSGFKEPYGVAVDGSGNVYVADTFKSAVKMISASCVANAGSIPCVASSNVAPGAFAIPSGVAVDTNGNVFVADAGFSTVREVPAACIAGANNNSCVVTLGGGFDTPYGVAVDASGNVYAADAGNETVSEIPPGCTNSSCVVQLGGGFDTPYGVAVGTGGTFYVADTSNWQVKKFWQEGVDFGTVPVATSTAARRTLNFVFTSAGSIGAPVVVTGGAPNLDFSDAGTGSCTTQGTGHLYKIGDVCTVDVNLAPQHPGARNGAVLLEDHSGKVLAIGYIHGIGASPQITFADITSGNYIPGAAAAMGGGLSFPQGLAVDGAGNVYVADNGNNLVKRIPYSCSNAGCVATLSGNFSSAMDVAVDGAGNIYVADTGNHAVKEIPVGCTLSGCVLTVGGGFTLPEGVKVDGNGNVYVADNSTGVVSQIPVGCATSACVATVATGFTQPQGIALDGYGNVYVANNHGSTVTEIAPGCANAACGTALGGGFVMPISLALDAAGNIFVADLGQGSVMEIPAGCQGSGCVLTVGSGPTAPWSVALNGSGNLYVSDVSRNLVTLLDFVDPPSLAFATTSIDYTSADSPQTVVVLNDGNQSLKFSALQMPSDFTLSGGGSVCSSSTMLAADAFCTLPIDFVPVSTGLLSENLTLIDNNLNAPANPGAQQLISVASTGNPPPDTTTTSVTISPNSLTSSQTATVTATVSDTGVRATQPTGTVMFSWSCSGICGYDTGTSFNGASGFLNSGNPVPLAGGVATVSGVNFGTAGTYTVTAAYSGVTETFLMSNNAAQSDGNNQATVTWSPGAAPAPAPVSLGSVNLGSSTNQTVTFTFAAAGTIGMPVVVTQGATGKDFTDVGDGTCTTHNGSSYGYNAGDSCTVDVSFSPQVPGMRNGAVLLKDTAGHTLATEYIYGVGSGSEIGFLPGTESTLTTSANGLGSPLGAALDGNGNLYIADHLSHAIWQTTPGKVTTKILDLSGGAGIHPGMLAVDGAGNLYIADSSNGAVLQATPSGSGYVLNPTAVVSGLSASNGVAVDQAGNVYVANSGGNQILKETLQANGSYQQSIVVDSTDTPLGTALNTPYAVAVDASGNVYISDTYNNRVIKETWSGSWTPTLVAGGLDWPMEITVDGNGNVYFANFGHASPPNAGVYKETLQSNLSYVQSVLPTGLTAAQGFGLALDGSGNIYIMDATDDQAVKVNYATPPALSFNTTAVGSSSTDSPQAVTVSNNGNAPLIFSGLAAPDDFPLDSTGGQVCSSSTNLAASASCTLPIDFTPVGSNPYSTTLLNENLTLTDNSMNAASATQPIALSGTGIAPTITFSLPAGSTLTAGTVGVAYNASFQAAGGAGPYSYIGNVPPGLTLSSSGQISGTPTAVENAFSITVTATDANGFTGSKSYSLTIGQGTAAINITPYSLTYDANPHTATGTATGANALDLSARLTLTGTTHTNAGTYASDAWSFTDPAGNYAPASGTVSDQIAQATATINVWGYTANFNGGIYSAGGTATGVSGIDLSSDFNFLGTQHAAAGTYLGDPWTFTDPAGNYATASGNVSDTINMLTATAAAPAATSFGTVSVGTTTSQTVTFTIQTAGAIGMPVVVTRGATGLDFTDVGDGSCTLNNGASFGYVAGATCVVDVSFSPQVPGMRTGAVLLKDNSGNTLATAYVYGTGTGPMVSFSPGTASTLAQAYTSGSGFSGLWGLAVDGSGNVFVSDSGNNAVKEIAAAGGYTGVTPLAVANGNFSNPAGLAVDGSGNVFVSDYGHGLVKEIVAAGGYTAVNTLAIANGNFSHPRDVAVDGSGNVFVTDAGHNVVKEIVAAGGYTTVNTLAVANGNLNDPCGLAVDGSGNVFVADEGNNVVKEIVAAGGYTTVNTLAVANGHFSSPCGAAVDGSGNVFVADYGNNAVKEILAAGGFTTANTLAVSTGAFNNPESVAMDGSGNLFITDQVNTVVKKLDFSDAPSLNFASTAVGFTSTDSPQTVTVTNIGNATLDFSGVSSPTDFPLATMGGMCFSTATLTANASCTLPIDFTPLTTNPSFSEILTLADNSLNVSLAVQPITLAGTGIAPTITFTFPSVTTLAQGTVGVSYNVSFQATGGAGPYTYSGNAPPGLTLANSGLLSGTPTAVESGFSITVTATDANGFTGSQVFTLPISQGLATISIAPYSVTYDANAHTATGTATGYNGVDLSAGLTFTGTTHTSAGTYAGDSWTFHDAGGNYADTGGTITDTIAQATATFSIAPYHVTYDANAHTATGTATGVGAVDLSTDLHFGSTTHTNAQTYATDAWTFHDPAGNYADGGGTISDQISPATATVNVTGYTVNYDGNPHSANAVATGVGAVDLSADVNLGSTLHSSVGSYTDPWSFTDAAGNYTSATGTVSDSIAQVTAAVTAPPNYSFGSVGIGSTSNHPVAFTFNAVGSIGTPVVVTMGATGLDFTDLGDGSCNTNGTSYDYGVGATCTVDVQISPQYPGGRMGAVLLEDGSGNILATALLYGVGTGPMIHFSPFTESTLNSSFTTPHGVAADASGNVYLADSTTNLVQQIPPGCTASGCLKTLGGGFNQPSSVAIDNAGNVYVADFGNSAIKEIPASCIAGVNNNTCVVTLGSGFNHPQGVAVDAGGNVYVADTLNSAVDEMTPGCANLGCVIALGAGYGFNRPGGVAIDSLGNVYVADSNNGTVEEMTPDCHASACVTVLGGAQGSSGFTTPRAVAVDANNNVYVADGFTARVMPSGCATAACVTNTGGNFSTLYGVAVDQKGNILVADSGRQSIDELDYADAPSLGFNTIPAGSTSTDSPKTVTVINAGNALLSFSGVSAPTDFPLDATGGQVCSAATTLAATAACTLPIDFTPTTNTPLNESVTLDDNSLSVTSSRQTIAVSGTGTTPTITFTLPVSTTLPAGTVGVSYSGASFQATGGATPYAYTGIMPSGMTLSTGGVLSGTPAVAGTAISITVLATDKNGFTGSQNYTISLGKGAASFSITPYTETYDGNAHTATGTATGVNNVDLSAGLTLTATTHSSAGSYTDTWNFHDANGNYADATGTVSDTIAKASATVNINSYSETYDGNAHTATGTATGVNGVDLSSGLNLAGTTHTNAGAYAADTWIFTDASGNYQNSTGTVTDVISKASATINVTPYNLTYDGNAHTATGTATGAGGVILSSGDLTLTGTTHTNAGTYANDAWSFHDANGNYVDANGTVTDSIARASATINVTPYDVSYDGNAHTATGTATGAGGVTLNNSDLLLTGTTHTNAGTYAGDAWSFSDASGNYLSAGGTVTDVIAKASATINVTPYDVNYDGNPHTATGTATGADGVALSSNDLVLTGTTHTNAANYANDTWSFSDASGNYQNSTGTVTDVISKASATINITPYNLTYDGNAHTATGTAAGVGGVTLSSGDLILTGTTHSNAGTYGNDAWSFHDANGNYADASGTVSDTLAKASATINITPYSLIFDGNAHTATGSATGVGGVVLSSSDLILTGTTHSNAGSYAGDAWSFADPSGNYLAASGSTSDQIARATATINVTPYVVSYDGNPHAATGTATGAGGIALSGSDLVLTATSHTNPGTYANDAWSFSDASGNYVSASGTVSDTINTATATVTLGGLAQVYTGLPLAATAGTTPSGLTVNITYTGTGGTIYSQSATPPTLTGSYTVVGAISSADYTGSSSGTMVISQAASQVTALTSNLNPAMPGNNVTLTATVTSAAGTPTGTVTFLDNTNTILGHGALASGQATLTTSFTAAQAGANQITAVYGGDSNFLGSSGGSLAESVMIFTLTPGSGSVTSQTVPSGGSAIYDLTIAPTSGTTFPGVVTLSVSGLPTGATATISPSTWTALTSTSWSLPANTPITTVALTIQVPASTARLDRQNMNGAKLAPVFWGILLLPFAFKLRRAGKRMRGALCSILLLAAGAAAMTALGGCGGSSGSSTPSPTPVNYTITVTATSGAVSSNTTLYLTVN